MYQKTSLLPYEDAIAIAANTAQLENMYRLQMRDIDAGEVDRELDQAISDISILRSMEEPLNRFTPEARSELSENMYRFSKYREFGMGLKDLTSTLTDEEGERVLPLLSSLIGKSKIVGRLFPEEIESMSMDAYGESITSTVFTLTALKRGDELPKELPLLSGKTIAVGTYTFEKAVKTLESLCRVINEMDLAFNRLNRGSVTRVNQTGAYGMYRGGVNKNILATVRLQAGTSFDPAIEYGNSSGTQASIGFSAEENLKPLSVYKSEHRSPISIRIDNEGDKLALDIGSILGKKGTLGKRVADLIAIGDAYRAKHTHKNPTLNHNSTPYEFSGLHDKEAFARIAADLAENLERRAALTSVRQLALKQTVAS